VLVHTQIKALNNLAGIYIEQDGVVRQIFGDQQFFSIARNRCQTCRVRDSHVLRCLVENSAWLFAWSEWRQGELYESLRRHTASLERIHSDAVASVVGLLACGVVQ